MSPPNRPPNGLRWIGPREEAPFDECYHLATDPALSAAVGNGLTVYACPRLLGSTRELSELASAGETVQLLGVWCEGEGRTGKTVPGVQRVFWHAWPEWWRQRAAATAASLSLPGPVWIQTRDAALAGALLGTLHEVEQAAVWVPANRLLCGRPAAVLWDGSQLGGLEADRLRQTCRAAAALGAPVLAMLDFPRPETVAAARSIGARAVLGKPFDADLLLRTLAGHAGQPLRDATGDLDGDGLDPSPNPRPLLAA